MIDKLAELLGLQGAAVDVHEETTQTNTLDFTQILDEEADTSRRRMPAISDTITESFDIIPPTQVARGPDSVTRVRELSLPADLPPKTIVVEEPATRRDEPRPPAFGGDPLNQRRIAEITPQAVHAGMHAGMHADTLDAEVAYDRLVTKEIPRIEQQQLHNAIAARTAPSADHAAIGQAELDGLRGVDRGAIDPHGDTVLPTNVGDALLPRARPHASAVSARTSESPLQSGSSPPADSGLYQVGPSEPPPQAAQATVTRGRRSAGSSAFWIVAVAALTMALGGRDLVHDRRRRHNRAIPARQQRRHRNRRRSRRPIDRSARRIGRDRQARDCIGNRDCGDIAATVVRVGARFRVRARARARRTAQRLRRVRR